MLIYCLEEPGDQGTFRIVQANEAAGRLLGIGDLTPFIGKRVAEINPQVYDDPNYSVMLAVAESGEPQSLGRVEVNDPELGAHGLFLGQAFPLPNRCVGVVFEDVAEQARIEERLAASEREFRALADASLEGIAIVREGTILLANGTLAGMLGREADDLTGKAPDEILGFEAEHIAARAAEDETHPVEGKLRRADGRTLAVEVRVRNIHFEGRPARALILRDVSEARAAAAALRTSEQQYRTLVEALHEGVVLHDHDGTIIASNTAAERILGLSADQIAGRTSLDSAWRVIDTDGEPLPGDRHPATVALRTGEAVHNFVQGVYQPSGELRWILVNASVIKQPGRKRQVVVTFYDITEQREAEESLRVSVIRKRTILSTLAEGVLLIDREGHILLANRAAQQIFGIRDREPTVVLSHLRAYVSDESGRYVPEEALPERLVLETGQSYMDIVQRFTTADGTTRWFSVNAQPVHDEEGEEPLAAVISFVDVSEQRAAERELRQREAQLNAAQQIAHLGSWRWDLSSNELSWSGELKRIFGRDISDVAPTIEEYYAMMHPAERGELEKAIERAVAQGIPYDILHRVLLPDGRTLHIQARGEVELDAADRVVALHGTALDATESVRAREALQRYARELEERNAELEQFAYVASHDLQEPLRMVSSFLQLLERRYTDKLDETGREYIGFAVDGAKRMQNLIQDLLAYSRVGTRGKPFQRVDMSALGREVIGDLGPAIADCEATVDLGDLPTVVADPTQMRQLLQNLISNALKFRAEEPPVVRVRAETARLRDRAAWRFTVSDNGIGISPEHHDRIFQIFQRLHTRDEYEGTGIGLAICRRIVERHGGTLEVDSAPGRGTTFAFLLPQQPPAAHAS